MQSPDLNDEVLKIYQRFNLIISDNYINIVIFWRILSNVKTEVQSGRLRESVKCIPRKNLKFYSLTHTHLLVTNSIVHC